MSRRKRPTQRTPVNPVPILIGLSIVLATIGAVAVLAFGRGTASVATEPGAPGRLVASQTTVDLGRVPFDKQVEARFELANTGGETIRLVGAPQVRMLEGCCPARPAVSSTAIPSGSTLTVRYPYMMHDGMGGPHRFEITLTTDSPETPRITLTVVALSG